MNNWGANHGAISYGHIGADLLSLASMLRIPVCMHNVARGGKVVGHRARAQIAWPEAVRPARAIGLGEAVRQEAEDDERVE